MNDTNNEPNTLAKTQIDLELVLEQLLNQQPTKPVQNRFNWTQNPLKINPDTIRVYQQVDYRLNCAIQKWKFKINWKLWIKQYLLKFLVFWRFFYCFFFGFFLFLNSKANSEIKNERKKLNVRFFLGLKKLKTPSQGNASLFIGELSFQNYPLGPFSLLFLPPNLLPC